MAGCDFHGSKATGEPLVILVGFLRGVLDHGLRFQGQFRWY